MLWKPHLYTVGFKKTVITRECPEVYSDFINMMKSNSPQPFHGKLGHSIIKTQKSIRRHFNESSDWQFYYEDGNLAKQKSIMNQINSLNSYVLENSFDNRYEKQWEDIYLPFVAAVHNGKPVAVGNSERIISRSSKEYVEVFLHVFM